MRGRIKLLGLVFLVSSAALVARLFFWQIIKSQELAGQARLQHQSGEELQAPRGNILASDGGFLAATTQGWLVWASKPDLQSDAKVLANRLAPFFVGDEENEADRSELLLAEAIRIQDLLTKNDSVWIPLKHRVESKTKSAIEALNLAGIGFESEDLRSYPEASIAAQVLGFVGKDEEGADHGYFGVEGFYDLELSGKEGFVQRESDARGIPILSGSAREISAVGGVDLVTHIDKTIQLIVEKKLAEGIEKYGAKSGWVVVMNPETGAIAAMAAWPSYDPGEYWKWGNDYFKNPVISDSFEPGSIFKPLVMAAALDAGVVSPDTKCDICGDAISVDKYSIETWNKEYRPDSTMTDVIVHSDNVGMVFVGNRLGADRLYDYLAKFGIGKATGIDLQGEANPGIREKNTWNIVDLATASFGQGVAVTPIQMIRGIAAIANDGVIMEPQVVDKIKLAGWQSDIKPVAGQRVISKGAADEITAMMVKAASEGEAKWTAIGGFGVAGKTGTAQIPVKGHYDEDKTIGSFVGFAPADNPKFVMLVSLTEPQSSPWASETAAPLWFAIANELFVYLGIGPKN